MKTMILAITFLASSAFAGTYVSYPAYDGVSVDNLCDAGNAFQTINPIKTCESWTEVPATGGDNSTGYPSEYVCNSYTTKHTTVSKTGTDCLKYGTGDADAATCVEYGTVQRPNTVIAEKITDRGDTQAIEHFYFTIPACK